LNLPNVLTVSRIFLTVLFIILFNQFDLMSTVLALIVFTAAALTDFLDGYLARKHNLISQFGKIMDPIADKFLILSAFFMFAQLMLIPFWMFLCIFAREVIVTGLRFFAMSKGITLAAEGAGKLKTVLQIVAVYLIMIFVIVLQMDVESQWILDAMPHFSRGINIAVLMVVAVTLWSGFSFVRNNRKELFHPFSL